MNKKPTYFFAYLFGLSMFIVFSGCKIMPIIEQPEDKRATTIIAYLKANLEQDEIKELDQSFYQNNLTPIQLEQKRAYVWNLWKKANENRLKENELSENSNKEFVWKIPAAQEMKVQTLIKGDKPAMGYPFIINLHGGGKDPDAISPWASTMNSREWQAAKTLSGRYDDSPSFHFVPRMADDRIGRWYLKPQQKAWLRAWQLAVLNGIADPDRVYIMGISEGGYGSHRIGMFLADYFAGVGPMAGAEPFHSYIENLRNTSFRMEVGEFDSGFDRNKFAIKWKEELAQKAQQNLGEFNHVVIIQKGMGHGIDYMNVSPWLVRQTRKTYPENLSFLYYSLDGYRNGFGYVRLDKLSKNDGEIIFRITKKGNHYDVKTETVKGNVSGKITLYVDNVNWDNPVTVTFNSKEVFNQKLTLNEGTLVESLILFGDPKRLFGAKVDIEVN